MGRSRGAHFIVAGLAALAAFLPYAAYYIAAASGCD
jgi:hypothetical protein